MQNLWHEDDKKHLQKSRARLGVFYGPASFFGILLLFLIILVTGIIISRWVLEHDIILYTAKPGGNYYKIGEAYSNKNKNDMFHYANYINKDSNGSLSNINSVINNPGSFGLSQHDTIELSKKDLRTSHLLTQLKDPIMEESLHILVNNNLLKETDDGSGVIGINESLIESINDSDKVYYGINPDSKVVAEVINALGIANKQIHAQTYGFDKAVENINSGELDFAMFWVATPLSSISEIPRINRQFSFISLSEDYNEKIKKLRQDIYNNGIINTDYNLARPVSTIEINTYIVTSSNTKDQTTLEFLNRLSSSLESSKEPQTSGTILTTDTNTNRNKKNTGDIIQVGNIVNLESINKLRIDYKDKFKKKYIFTDPNHIRYFIVTLICIFSTLFLSNIIGSILKNSWYLSQIHLAEKNCKKTDTDFMLGIRAELRGAIEETKQRMQKADNRSSMLHRYAVVFLILSVASPIYCLLKYEISRESSSSALYQVLQNQNPIVVAENTSQDNVISKIPTKQNNNNPIHLHLNNQSGDYRYLLAGISIALLFIFVARELFKQSNHRRDFYVKLSKRIFLYEQWETALGATDLIYHASHKEKDKNKIENAEKYYDEITKKFIGKLLTHNFDPDNPSTLELKTTDSGDNNLDIPQLNMWKPIIEASGLLLGKISELLDSIGKLNKNKTNK